MADETGKDILNQSQLGFRARIDKAKNYAELFELVKRIVEIETGKHRAGLALILQDMPNAMGAYHPVGTNNIVLNRSLVDGMKVITKEQKQVNYFVFMVLMHEYLHSLGYLDEMQVRRKCQAICSNALGPDHPVVKLATANWMQMHPELEVVGRSGFSESFELVNRFDTSSMSYIS